MPTPPIKPKTCAACKFFRVATVEEEEGRSPRFQCTQYSPWIIYRADDNPLDDPWPEMIPEPTCDNYQLKGKPS